MNSRSLSDTGITLDRSTDPRAPDPDPQELERFRSEAGVGRTAPRLPWWRERVVFNIKGNAYRLVVAVDFEKGIVWVKWIGTLEDYDRIDVTEVEHDE